MRESSHPPLIAKIAMKGKHEDLLREASIYNDLEQLQGMVIPRCFGYFDVEAREGEDCIPWQAWQASMDRKCSDPQVFDSTREVQEGHEATASAGDKKSGIYRFSVLLLERLGDKLPVGARLPDGAR
jgi:hypothetical protein